LATFNLGPLIGREHVSSPAVAPDPRNVLSHDQKPMLDSVMVASSVRNGALHTTHTDDSLKPIKRSHHDLDHTTDMVMHSIDRRLRRNELATASALSIAIQAHPYTTCTTK
jgi:hypothetical protein